MTAIDTQSLLRAVDCLNERLEQTLSEPDVPADSLEKIAKAISAQIKTLKEADAYNEAAREHDENTKYISYEDYPPLRPGDRQALVADLETLFARLSADPGESD